MKLEKIILIGLKNWLTFNVIETNKTPTVLELGLKKKEYKMADHSATFNLGSAHHFL